MNCQFKENIGHILINHGLCKERTISTFLKNHVVKINGKKAENRLVMADSEKDEITVDNEILEKCRHLYIMLNKPKGYVCSSVSDSHLTVYDLLPDDLKKQNKTGSIHCAGRLDSDTTGLLILTTNGSFSHYLTEPKNDIKKSYYVKLELEVDCNLQEQYKKKCIEGIKVDEEKKSPSFTAKPCNLEWKSNTECIITVTEGKFHEVRRIFSKLGNNVVILKRISMNNIKLDENLMPGHYKLLERKEIEE